MKVFFLITNTYIDTYPYLRISASLKALGIEALFCCYLKDDSYDGSKGELSVPVITVPVLGSNHIEKNPLRKILQFMQFMLDRNIITAYFKRERPDLVVMGGDITDHYGRLFIDVFRRLNIKVLLVPVALPGPDIINPDASKGIPLAGIARFILRLLDLEKTIFFRGWLLGSYHKESYIAVPNRDVKHTLSSKGISSERMEVTGSPSYDLLYDEMIAPAEEIKLRVNSLLNCSVSAKLVVYFAAPFDFITEHEEFGNWLYLLQSAFCDLPQDYFVVIKLHPREKKEAEFKKYFKGERYRIIRKNVSAYELMRAAELVIADETSATIVDAALLGSNILSFKMKESEFLRFGAVHDCIHITSKEEVVPKIRSALFDDNTIRKQKEVMSAWKEKQGIIINNSNSDRIAQLIKKLLYTDEESRI